MSAKQTALIAVIVTSVGATMLAAFTATPDTVIQLTFGVGAFLASGLVLLGLLWTPWLRALSLERQRRAIWITAGTTGFIVCFLPMAIWMLRR